MDSIFLDTGYIIALEASDDQNHKASLQHWSLFSKNLPLIVTTSYIFNETVTFFNNRGHHQKSVEIGTNLLKSLSIRFTHVDQALFQEGWTYFKKHSDKTYSLTDCISFVLMKRLAIKRALTFDNHFIQAGFKVLPD
ncbi:MAG: PIN domain-containing protein [Thermodesulfovibrionales bacterium]